MIGPDAQTWVRVIAAAKGAQADGETLERELIRERLSIEDCQTVANAQARLYLASRELSALAAKHGHGAA